MTQKVWFITGATRGIGALTVEAALAAGDKVAATGRRKSALLERFGERDGLLLLEMDVTDTDAVERAIGEAVAHFGRLDIVLNNAGFGMLGTLEESTMEEFRHCVETNFFGTVLVCKAAVPYLRKQGGGHIINVTSAGGFRPVQGFSAYCAAKFAVEGLSETLGMELGPLGIHVTAVQPGYVKSDFCEDTSIVIVPREMPEYDKITGFLRRGMESKKVPQPGDPAKVAAGIVKLGHSEKPPRWLPLGPDSVEIIESKLADVQADIEAWREVATSTYFD
jgi:NAD(P)-dependent dehydrogenase (short-subunit alcohol dehydrogenase family)